jgi:hypothetical protein
MKTKLFTMVLCSLMLFGLGCSSENEPNVSDNGKEQPVNLQEEEPNVPEEEEPNVPGENEPDVPKEEGYIVGQHPCTRALGDKPGGYYIITENPRDTFLTFNMPDSVAELPLIFKVPDKDGPFRCDYKIRLTYRIVEENEKRYVVCPANLPLGGYPPSDQMDQIIITSIEML